jgi:hypothetical protein
LPLAALLALALAAPAQAGVQHLSYRYGPVAVAPGQNTIAFDPNRLKPPVDGYILSLKPNLVRPDGSVPPVDVLHLHHGVWVSNGRPLFAVGEEKTSVTMPPGYGWLYRTSDSWLMNHMVHNLTPTRPSSTSPTRWTSSRCRTRRRRRSSRCRRCGSM